MTMPPMWKFISSRVSVLSMGFGATLGAGEASGAREALGAVVLETDVISGVDLVCGTGEALGGRVFGWVTASAVREVS